ncbi:MAG: hypothetical protein MUO21_12185, partial [Nitrososphaeraceae archaeon]|nr:hypothetical protein [Nitrososphaeraceae archaeon]
NMADCHDAVYKIMSYITFYDSLFYASQTCKLWRSVANEILPKFINSNYDIDACFKITKIRFLLTKDTSEFELKDNYPLFVKMCHAFIGRYPKFRVLIFDRRWKDCVSLAIKPVREDDSYIVYESEELPPAWRLRTLKWKIACPLFSPNKPETQYVGANENTQIVPDDLCYQWFKRGNEYKQDDEEVVIGSAGGWNSFKCCCAIKLLPDTNEIKVIDDSDSFLVPEPTFEGYAFK